MLSFSDMQLSTFFSHVHVIHMSGQVFHFNDYCCDNVVEYRYCHVKMEQELVKYFMYLTSSCSCGVKYMKYLSPQEL